MHEKQPRILPMSIQEAEILGIKQFDVILISGDAYVDHPSCRADLIGRVLWDSGYTVGIIAQPDWKRDDNFLKLGDRDSSSAYPLGTWDSMVNNLTPNLNAADRMSTRRQGCLPAGRAVIVYTNKIHSLYPGIPIIGRDQGELALVCSLRLLVGLRATVHSG